MEKMTKTTQTIKDILKKGELPNLNDIERTHYNWGYQIVDTCKEYFNRGIIKARRDIIEKTSRGQCIDCEKNLDQEYGDYRWHIPLCRKCRKREMINIINNKIK